MGSIIIFAHGTVLLEVLRSVQSVILHSLTLTWLTDVAETYICPRVSQEFRCLWIRVIVLPGCLPIFIPALIP